MSHIFGIKHSLSGIIGQVGSLFGKTQPLPIQTQSFFPGYVSPNAFQTRPDAAVDETFGASAGMGAVQATGGRCAPTPKTKRYTTTVCADGTTHTREQKSRKRKRRLATVSDIKDLAALKNILGGGKAFDVWIATRGR